MLSVALSNVIKLSVALLHVVMPNVVVPFLSMFLQTFCCFTTAEKKNSNFGAKKLFLSNFWRENIFIFLFLKLFLFSFSSSLKVF